MKTRTEVLAITAIAAAIVGAAGCGSNNTSTSADNEIPGSPAPAASPSMGTAERTGKALDSAGQHVKNGVHNAAAESAAAAHAAAAKTRMAAHNAVAKTGAAVHHVGHDVKETGASVAVAADRTVSAAGRGLRNAAAPLILTPRVKMALINDTRVDASAIRVSTIAAAHHVVLSGSVPTADKKLIAGQVAEETLRKMQSTYTVENDIQVSGH